MLAIVSNGLQDRERLNSPVGQPSIRFYSKVFRRRTRWASWWRRVDFDTQPDFGKRATVTLPIIGELITRATLVVELPDLVGLQKAAKNAGAVAPFWSWTNDLGHALCRTIDFTINGYPIVSLDSRRMAILDEQTQPVEHFDSTNLMVGRNVRDFGADLFAPLGQSKVLEIIPPFWWNRGPGPQALPIQALSKDKVQITVDFRDIQECVYTSSRSVATGAVMDVSDVTTPSSCNALPSIPGAGFIDGSGAPIPGQKMPTSWSFLDAFWVIEYVSLEDREAAAFRMADLEIPIEQHVALQPRDTGGAKQIRIPIETGGLIRDMTWVAQRTEATDYNAYFLYSRDINVEGETGVWWPDAQIPNWDYWKGNSVRPAFADRRSDPLLAAQFLVRHKERFNHDGAALFRSLIPALGSSRTPLVDRYIYRYDFGLWPTGGLAEALTRPLDEFRGAANWDLLNNKELILTMDTNTKCQLPIWTRLTGQRRIFPANTIAFLETYFPANTDAFHVALYGGSPGHPDKGGEGALVEGVVDFQTLQRTPHYVNTIVRTNTTGSASLVMETRKPGEDSRFTWLAVAGGGGYGPQGGYAASAVAIGQRGGGSYLTHVANANYGGGGGGRGPEAGVGLGATGSPGPTAGIQMPTTFDFVYSHQTTGGNGVSPAQAGGDGYYGGGGGVLAGGGGGSYVSRYISEVFSQAGEAAEDSYAIVTPLRRIPATPPSFNIYIWLTRINMLRITGGHGVLLFSA
jgi:hypothetical protein